MTPYFLTRSYLDTKYEKLPVREIQTIHLVFEPEGFFNSKILLILALGLTFVHFEIIYLMTKVEMSLSRVFTFL